MYRLHYVWYLFKESEFATIFWITYFKYANILSFSPFIQTLSNPCINYLNSLTCEILSSFLETNLAALYRFGFNFSIAILSLLRYFLISWLILRVHTYDGRYFSAILATAPPFFSICGIGLFLADWFVVFSIRIWQIFASSILASVIYFEKFSFWVRNWAVTCCYSFSFFVCSDSYFYICI